MLLPILTAVFLLSYPMSVPPGAQRVPMGTVQLQAACGNDVTVSAVTLWHEGLGDVRDIRGVYLAQGWQRITRSRPVSSGKGDVTLNFRPILIKGCTTLNMEVYADMSPTAAITGEHRFVLRSDADIDSDSPVALQVTSQAVPVQTVGQTVGQVTVTFLDLTNPIRYGAGRTLSRFRLESDTRDNQLIHAITLTNDGSAADKDLQNLALFVRGQEITSIAPHMTGDRVRLVFDPPFLLEKSTVRLLELRGDVRASRRKTIGFFIEEGSDVEATVVRGR